MWRSDFLRVRGGSGNYGCMTMEALVMVALSACGDVRLEATTRAELDDAGMGSFSEEFDALDSTRWTCEGHCPTVTGGLATFSLLPGEAPSADGSWSKVRYLPRRFDRGSFSVRFALGARPSERVFWGVALYDEGPAEDRSQYSEVNFGYTTDGSLGDTQLLLTSARLGKQVSLAVDTGKNLYDGAFHTGKLVVESTRVELYFDGELVESISDTSVIPAVPMDLILGTRLVSGPALPLRFEHIIDRCDIEW